MEQEICETCGKPDACIRVEADVDGKRSWHYVCSEECEYQLEDVIREEED